MLPKYNLLLNWKSVRESSFQSWLQGASPSQFFAINTDCTKNNKQILAGKAGLISLEESNNTCLHVELVKEIIKYISLSPEIKETML